MSPDKARKETDELVPPLVESGYTVGSVKQQQPFSLNASAETLALRAGIPVPKHEASAHALPTTATTISLEHALKLGAAHDRTYQTRKEDIYLKALALDEEMHAFELTFAGMIGGNVDGDFWRTRQAGATAGASARRKMSQGASLVGSLALSVSRLLREDINSTSLLGDLTLTVPLLRGSGQDIVLEPVRQAERNLVDAIWDFERYRQTYAVDVISDYLSVLEALQRLRNAEANRTRLQANQDRAQKLFEAGRMDRVQFDQANQDYLSAGETVISYQANYETSLDTLRIRMGLPPDALVDVETPLLETLQAHYNNRSDVIQTNNTDALPSEQACMRAALTNRFDYRISQGSLADTKRKLKVYEDALRAELNLTGGISANRTRTGGRSTNSEAWSGSLELDFPWEREAERNDYRAALISIAQAERALSLKEDQMRQRIRLDLRNLRSAQAAYAIQRMAVDLARRRVESNELFSQAGRSQMRDVLEAESALLSAQNALLNSVMNWQMCELDLQLDMGVLDIRMDGSFDWMRLAPLEAETEETDGLLL